MTTISNIDLHCHTRASDGALSPAQVVERAFGRGLNYLAITDHDVIGGVEQACNRARELNELLVKNDPDAPLETFIKPNAVIDGVTNGTLERTGSERQLTIIPGIEFSTTWNDEQIHVVGLYIDIKHEALSRLIEKRTQSRHERAVAISEKLARNGIENAYERCCAKAQEGAAITRGNYARLIFEDGKANSVDEAFHKYLRRGQCAYVKTQWGPIDETIEAIVKSGGVAVLAHPRRYNMSNQRLRRLISEFKSWGGESIEVSSSQQKPSDRTYLEELAVRYDMLASLGSDFHNDGIYRDLGQNIEVKESLKSVWQHERAAQFGLGPDFKQRLVHITYQKDAKAPVDLEAQQ